MGADIHVMILHRQENGKYKELKLYTKNPETKKKERIDWNASWESRDYTLFSKLAGVRGCETPIVDSLRGWFDKCPKKLVDKYQSWTHSATYYDWCELEALALTKGMTEYMDCDQQYNIVETWMDYMRVMLDAYNVWYPKPGEVIIQICFDC